MNQKNEDTDEPLIGQIAEHYQEDRKSMMKSVFEEIALRPNENMTKKSTEMLAELSNIEHLHFKGHLRNRWHILPNRKR